MSSSSSPSAEAHASLVTIARELVGLERDLSRSLRAAKRAIRRVPIDRRASAENLVHYLALRHRDLRDLQAQLSERGLSSLGRSESCVMASLLEVSARVHESLALRGDARAARHLARLEAARTAAPSWESARALLHRHTREILGERPENRHIYVMVTAPSAAEADRAWMVKLLRAGMNVLRINGAHEGEREWARICEALDAARRETGKECRVLVDLAGPKIRTGPVRGARRVLTWRPARDEVGRVVAPATVIVRRGPAADGPASALEIRDADFARVAAGDELRFRDARGKRRALMVRTVGPDELVCEAVARAYVLERARARQRRGGERLGEIVLRVGSDVSAAIDVRVGDTLRLSAAKASGRPPKRDAAGAVRVPGEVTCTLPAALEHLEVGHRVLFDDGRIHAVVDRISRRGRRFVLRIVRTQKEVAKLRAEKGINLPDTTTTIPSLTDDDRRALDFALAHADAVGLSFVRAPEDVRALHEAIGARGRSLGIVLKIETRAGFENLPRLLLEGLRRPPLAIMIARGDLAVEVGFERLAELQEEILWLCEASHVPAIWATQVLDTLARTGVPSRAEVTDAAASVAAECVMLNKGPFVHDAVAALVDILRRMEKHRYKKRSLFRRLRVSSFKAD